jgi:hypothetical protein
MIWIKAPPFGGRLGGAIHDLGSMDVPRGLGRD